MTTPLSYQVGTRDASRRKRLRSFAGDFRDDLLYQLDLSTQVQWPSPKYQDDPVGFFREILGVEPWEKQVEILEAVRDHRRVAVRSGHKVSKSHSAGGLALWFYSSFPDARVIMTSTTARQVDQILWRETRMMHARSGVCTECKKKNEDLAPHEKIYAPCPHSAIIPEQPGDLARTGLKSRDFREIVGFTAKESEAVAGISGRNLLYIIDEASGVAEAIFEAIEGNRAGGARLVMFSNPTKTEGEHYEAFHGKSSFYKPITVSSEETPNVKEGRVVIPGLAERSWIEEKKEEWGEDSPLYKVRVKGEHVLNEDGKIFSIHAITSAEERWHDAPEAGRLFIGLDPAGATGRGDPTLFCVRRGLKALEFLPKRGLNEDQILINLLALIGKHKLPRETPVVVFDREGQIGSSLYGLIQNHLELNADAFEMVPIRASDQAHRNPKVYDRQRDCLVANLEAWFREGGAIPEDTKLSQELHAPTWIDGPKGKIKVTPKKELRKMLGRSTDYLDSLCLSVWEPLSLKEGAPGNATPKQQDEDLHPSASFDPYASAAQWEPER